MAFGQSASGPARYWAGFAAFLMAVILLVLPAVPPAKAQSEEGTQTAPSTRAVAPAHILDVPGFFDPSQREAPLDLSAVPTIRFLTSPDFPPFNYRDENGELVGFNVDLAQAICSTLSITCTIQDWPFDQLGEALKLGQGDAIIAGLAMNAKTGGQFDFSSTYFVFPARFVMREKAALTVARDAPFPKDFLAGKKIAVRNGANHARFVTQYLKSAQTVGYADEGAALSAVQAGQADAFFGDAVRAAFWMNTNPGCCAFAGPPILRPDYFGQGLSIAVPAGRDALRLAIDHALARLQKSGKYEEIFLRWFPVSFY